MAKFQSTLPRRERPSAGNARLDSGRFNPRPRAGSDLPVRVQLRKWRVSIHAPRGERRGNTITSSYLRKFQSTPPRGERRLERGEVSIRGVSIHAPARGATSFPSHPLGSGFVSIHAPARGATRLAIPILCSLMFQSTPPRGERPPAERPCGCT